MRETVRSSSLGRHKRTGEILVNLNLIRPDQLKDALRVQEHSREKLGELVVKLGMVNPEDIVGKLDFSTGVPRLKLYGLNIDTNIVRLVSPQIISNNDILPIAVCEDKLIIASSRPNDYQLIDEIRIACGNDVVALPADEEEVRTAIRYFMPMCLQPELSKATNEFNQEEHKTPTTDVGMKNPGKDEDAPVVRLVNLVLFQAVLSGCSDIHIDVLEGQGRIRLRMDGILRDLLFIPRSSLPVLISRIKIMANMDIAEKRVPQDGRFCMQVFNRDTDFRVSTLPTANGEKAVIRVLDKTNILIGIERLGLSSLNLDKVRTLINRPYGMLLVTGPTGSGKTTTLYNILNTINSKAKNIITLEDPIEYTLSGINQVQVNPKAGLSFAEGLGSVLRQDPDIIMVGEIRDHQTARLAIQAALTGHLVLSTLHTNHASATIARLIHMGLERFLLAACLIGVISQRLVRQLCRNCAKEYSLSEHEAQWMGVPDEVHKTFFRPAGCPRCGYTGYLGRVALHEIVALGPHMRSGIHNCADNDDLHRAAQKDGMVTMITDGLLKAGQGLTSLEEVMKSADLET